MSFEMVAAPGVAGKARAPTNDGSALRHILLEHPEILTCAQRAAVSQSLKLKPKSNLKPEWLRQHRELCRAELFETLVRLVFPKGITSYDVALDANTVLKILKDPVFKYDEHKDDYESFNTQMIEMFNRRTFKDDDGSEWLGAHLMDEFSQITDRNTHDAFDYKPLYHRFYKGEGAEPYKKWHFLRLGKNFQPTGANAHTILSKVLSYGGGDENGEIVEILLKYGANPNTKVLHYELTSLFEIGFYQRYRTPNWKALKELVRHDDFINPLDCPTHVCGLSDRLLGQQEKEMWDIFFDKFPAKLNEKRAIWDSDYDIENTFGLICLFFDRDYTHWNPTVIQELIDKVIPSLERLLFVLRKATVNKETPFVYVHPDAADVDYVSLLYPLKMLSFRDSERAVEIMVECQKVVSNFIPRGLMASEFVTELLEAKYAKMASLETTEKLAARVSVLNMFENLREYFF